MSTETGPEYAMCLECDERFVDRPAMETHMKESVAPTGVQGMAAQGHRVRVVNPTPEERAQIRARNLVSRAVESALDAAFEDLDRDIRRGEVTEAAVTAELRGYGDFADGWADWLAAGDE